MKADGSEYPGEANTRALEDSCGNPIAFTAVTRDVIQRRKAELAHQESEDEFRSLYFTINEGVYLAEIIYDQSGRPIDNLIRDINPAMESITGFKRAEVVGRLASEFMTPPFLHVFAKVADSGEPISYETYFSPLQKHFQVSAFSTAKGRIAVVFSDVTKYKEIEAQLLAYQKELRSLASELTLAEERERRRIAIGIHDSISQKLAVCKMKLGALGRSAYLAGIDKPLAEIRALIEQLIQESRSLTFELSSPLLYAFGLKSALEQLTQQMETEFGYPFCFEHDGQPKPLDQDVRVLLFQVVRELLVNVTKHARARNAKVVMRRDGDNLIIMVEDDGIGFDVSHIGSEGRITRGFGLFGIRERLHYIHGNIEIRSKPGQGTRVTITAPLKSEPEE